jgi:phytoene dehydrogenase-like protein
MGHGTRKYDAVIVGAGPNGLAAAITLARAGRAVVVFEARDTAGGGSRSAPLTLPGYTHDVCSAVHPLGVGSPFFRALPLADYGLEWIYPPLALAHPLDSGAVALVQRSIAATAGSLGADGPAYRRLFAPLVRDWPRFRDAILGPLRLPRHPLALARFGLQALSSAKGLAERDFHGDLARALFAGMAAHSIQPIEDPATASFGLVLGTLAHAVGWPIARGGSQAITDALCAYLRALGGEIVLERRVESLAALPPAGATLLDVTPRQLLRLAGDRLPAGSRRQLSRYRYGPGVFKMDFALDGPVPWTAPGCAEASTVHLGGTLPEIAASERAVWQGRAPDRPFVLLAQPSMFDPTRAPAGHQTIWAYCHVPNGSTADMSGRIEAQIERFAPGFRDRILARSVMGPAAMECYNANYIGGDINGGVQDIRQLFTRPTPQVDPYKTALPGVYLCSSATPPGGGVHGMCGYWAARSALRYLRKHD